MVYALQLPKCDLMRKKDSKLFSLASCFSLHNYQNVSLSHCLMVSEKGSRERSPINVIQIQPTTRSKKLIFIHVGIICCAVLLLQYCFYLVSSIMLQASFFVFEIAERVECNRINLNVLLSQLCPNTKATRHRRRNPKLM